jgi:hypothetical protein
MRRREEELTFSLRPLDAQPANTTPDASAPAMKLRRVTVERCMAVTGTR